MTTLIILLCILTAGFIFWKLPKWIPLQWRIIAALSILLVIPAVILLGMAIAIILMLMLIIFLISFVINKTTSPF